MTVAVTCDARCRCLRALPTSAVRDAPGTMDLGFQSAHIKAIAIRDSRPAVREIRPASKPKETPQ
jgi:hypothetical protein